MRLVRFAVLEDPEGFAVWRLCPQFYRQGHCTHELVCSCVQSCGGPLRDVVSVWPEHCQAVQVADVHEAKQGGMRVVPDGRVIAGAELVQLVGDDVRCV